MAKRFTRAKRRYLLQLLETAIEREKAWLAYMVVAFPPLWIAGTSRTSDVQLQVKVRTTISRSPSKPNQRSRLA